VTYFGINQLIAGAMALLGAIVILIGMSLLYPLAAALMALPLAGIAIEAALRGGGAARPAGLSKLSRDRALLLFEARTGFRSIALANGQERMCADFARVELAYRGEQARATIAGQSSRHAMEIAGILAALAVLGGFALFAIPGTPLAPLLAVMALAVFRLLPQLAALRSACRLITLHADVADDVSELLERPVEVALSPAQPAMTLERKIVLSAITLTRPDRRVTIDALDLTITRGERIGIRGDSGIGKSSLLDILCGVIAPDSGSVRIDDRVLDAGSGHAWRERIGVVSQNPVLLGTTLREAVVFPEQPEEADAERFAAALAAAGVAEMVAGFSRGLDTSVGEAGNQLSGGQRQRLALAHALYRARDLLVLDEATGQLDPDSESAIVAAVAALPRDLTIVVASHRAPIFACCDIVYRLVAGKLVKAV
jgi:ABC-type multidrug transport system fused ATPase/permease subunit